MTPRDERIDTRITDDVIELRDLAPAAGDGSVGASVLFVGRVRDRNEDREVVGLEYDVYEGMADPVLRAIATEALERFEVTRVEAVHRTGRLRVGEISVAIAVGAAHRKAAYDASRYVIEEIKLRLPIWKRELYADGSRAWLEGRALTPAEGGKDSP